jgi:hypothetical protein
MVTLRRMAKLGRIVFCVILIEPLTRSSVLVQQLKIKLDTPEEIAKWVEDRRKRWPSRKRIEAKVRAFVHSYADASCSINSVPETSRRGC